MATNDFLTFAGDPAANVMTQAAYVDAGYTPRILGFSAGTALSIELNKTWRQASLIAHMIAQFTVDQANQDMLDDGTPSGLTALETNFTNALRNVALAAVGSGYLPLIGGSLSGNLVVNSNTIQVNAPTTQSGWIGISRVAGMAASFYAYTGITPRWQMEMASNEPEQGSDTGSNFTLWNYHDGGQPIGTPLTINRATGVMNLSHMPTVNGAPLTTAAALSSSLAAYLPLGGGVLSGALQVNGASVGISGTLVVGTTGRVIATCINGQLPTYSAAYNSATQSFAGGWWVDASGIWFGNMDGNGNPIANTGHLHLDSTGYLTLYGAATLNGWINTYGLSLLGGSFSIGINGSTFDISANGNSAAIVMIGGYPNYHALSIQSYGGSLVYYTPNLPTGGGAWNCDAVGNTVQWAQCFAAGYPGPSDASLKQNIAPWDTGLDAVMHIETVSYEFTPESKISMPGRRFIGVTAQDVHGVLPEAVVMMPRADDDEPERLAVESATIFYAAINAIKEIATRLLAVEEKITLLQQGTT